MKVRKITYVEPAVGDHFRASGTIFNDDIIWIITHIHGDGVEAYPYEGDIHDTEYFDFTAMTLF